MPPEEPQKIDNQSYDFILNTEEPLKPSLVSRINKKQLFILLGILLAGLVVGLIMLSDLHAKEASAQRARLVEIAQLQTEISRVSTIGIDQAVQPANKTRAQAIHDNMESTLTDTKDLLADRNGVIDEDQLNAKKDSTTDNQLSKAVTFSNFDKTFEKIIDEQLTTYQRALLAADKAGNKHEKQVLEADYKDADSILGLVDEK